MGRNTPGLMNWLIMLLLALIWGSSFILIKIGLKEFPPEQVGTLRISVSFIALSTLIPFYIKKVKLKDLKYIALVGLFGSGIPPILFALAQTKIDSSMAGIINSSVPLFTFIIGVLIFGAIFSFTKLIGVLIGLTGAVLLLIYGVSNPSAEVYLYGSLVLLATICYACSVNIVKKYLQEVNAIAISVFSFILIGIPAVIYLLTTDFIPHLMQVQKAKYSFLAIVVLALFGTAIANMLFFYLTQRTTALFASTVTYLIPVVAVGWGVGAGEVITWFHFIGMLLILFGVYLTSNIKKPFIKPQLQKSQH